MTGTSKANLPEAMPVGQVTQAMVERIARGAKKAGCEKAVDVARFIRDNYPEYRRLEVRRMIDREFLKITR